MRTRSAGLVAALFSGICIASPPMGLSAGGAEKVTVVMTSVTLADDCGGGGGDSHNEGARGKAATKAPALAAKAKRACQPSSMQLSVSSAEGGTLQVKSVELFDDAGKRVGELRAGSPTVFTDADAYQPWDQTVPAGKQLSISYRISGPDWSTVPQRWNKTFVVRAVVSFGGADQTVQKDVRVSGPPTSLPAGVKT